MSRSNKKRFVAIALSVVVLASCNEEIKYPLDYTESLYPNVDSLATTDNPIVQNTWEEYYKNVLTSDNVYKNTVQQILLEIAQIAHNNTTGANGTDVTKILDDSSFEGSVVDGTLPTGTYDNLNKRAETSMVSAAKNGTYSKDNLFYESKYVTALKQAFTLGNDFDETKINDNGKFISPNMKFADIYGGDYTYYKKNSLYNDEIINYLTSEYIYEKAYSSIGNSLSRNVQIIGLTDRTDEPGSAKRLLDAYVSDYIEGDKAGTDTDFSVLSRLWKGITQDFVDGIDTNTDGSARYKGRYDSSVVLTDDEVTWLKSKGVITDSASYTLAGKVAKDQKKLAAGANDYDLVDSTLESTYTGTYTYDYKTGVRKAIDDIASSSIVTKGIYTSSSSLSSIPSALATRIFSTNITTDKDDIATMKSNLGTSSDITVYEKDGYRYLTTKGTTSSDSTSNIIYYDSSSKTYYLVRILDAVSASALSKTNTNSMYDTDAKKEQIAREVAYAMSTTGSYKTESTIYWLRRTKINYSDEDFLTYMKTNYKDLFKTDSSYDSEPKIDLTQFAYDGK
jgi:hypothetical protein